MYVNIISIGYYTVYEGVAWVACNNRLVTRPLYSWLSMMTNNSRLSGMTQKPTDSD